MPNKLIGSVCFLLLPLILLSQNEINPNGYNRFYYKDGKISSEGNFKNGKPEGYWKTYYPNGKLKSEGYRQNFMLDSVWKFYDEREVLTQEINYKNDKKNGILKNYSSEGFLVSTENYINDSRENESYTFYENGAIKNEFYYKNNKRQGLGYEYDDEGTVIKIYEFDKDFVRNVEIINQKDRQGRRQGMWKEFYPKTKQVYLEGTYKDGLKHGYFREYSKKGILVNTAKYEMGNLVENAEELENLDIKTTYHTNGTIRTLKSYRNGILEGVSKDYDSLGNIVNSKIYTNGKLIGEGIVDEQGVRQGFWKEFFPESGKLRAEGNYKNGLRTGDWIFYFENGKVEQKGRYTDNGLITGTWRWYYPSGNIWREEEFRRGMEDGQVIEYSDTGSVIKQGQFIEGLEEGKWEIFVGDFYEVGEYRAGEKYGIWKNFYFDKTLAFEGEYINGLPYGKHTYYYPNGNKKLVGKYNAGQKDKVWTRYNDDGTIFIKIQYENGIEKKLDGFTIKPKTGEDTNENEP